MNRRLRHALTLVEVIIAIALIAALTVTMYAFYNNLLAARMHVIEDNARQRAVNILIERLEADLFTSLAGDGRIAGIEGDEHSIHVLSSGVAAHLAGQGSDAAGLFGDLQRSSYRYDPTQRVIDARRRAHPASNSNDNSRWQRLGGDIGKVQLRYHDGNGWRTAFNSAEAGRLPVAVEVSVWFQPWPGEEEYEDDWADIIGDRLTFDVERTFDEERYAELSDLDFDEPEPDRRRVIAIPDAAPAEDV